MQTFLPYPSFVDTAKCLDYKRLGKQRVEAATILNILHGEATSNAWQHHPAVLMWKGCETALEYYMWTIVSEWVKRGYKNNYHVLCNPNCKYPSWFGNEQFHASHRSNLLRKNSVYYQQFNWVESDTLPYIWPTKE